MAILATVFWIVAAAFVVWRIWARFHEPPPFDPDNPPDLRNFAPPKDDGDGSPESEERER